MDRIKRIVSAALFFVRTVCFWHRRYPRDSWRACIRIAWMITIVAYTD